MTQQRITLPPPPQPQDGERIADAYGVIREWDAEAKAWIEKGVLRVPAVVTEEANGLVSPYVFDRIRRVADNKNKLQLFKLQCAERFQPFPYFYYLHSSDDLIRFYGESKTKLRVEVDRGRLHQKVLRNFCIGEDGDPGERGERGKKGYPSRNECFLKFDSLTETEATLARDVPTPIDTPISLRIYCDDKKLSEIRIQTSGSEEGTFTVQNFTAGFLVDDKTTTVELSSTDPEKPHVSAVVRLKKGAFNSECRAKIRQVGPTGSKGIDGRPFLAVRDNVLNTDLAATKTVTAIRKAAANDDLIVRKLSLPTVSCVSRLKIVSLPIEDDASKDLCCSVQTITAECKYVCWFLSDFSTVEPSLSLTTWTPMKQCADRLRFGITTFDWAALLKDCTELPFKIAVDPRPPEQCCQEDLFMCPNLGDSECTVDEAISAPRRSETAECACDCTPAPETIDFTGEQIVKTYKCALNGNIDQYIQGVVINGVSRTKIDVALKYGDYCDEFQPTAECNFTTNIIPKCISETCVFEDDGIRTIAGEGTTSYVVNGDGCSISLCILVNQERVKCCRGYDLTITVDLA